MALKSRIFTHDEIMNIQHETATYYMACILKKLGAQIEFNPFNIFLEEKDIIINGFLSVEKEFSGNRKVIFEAKDD